MVLNLNVCILKVTDAIAFKFMLPIYRLQILNFRNVSDFFRNENASLQTEW